MCWAETMTPRAATTATAAGMRPNLLTRKALLVVDAAGAVVDGLLRVHAQRPRARDGAARAHLARHDAVRRLPLVDPVVDHRGPVDDIGSGTACAVQDAGHHEHAHELMCVRIARHDLIVILHAAERR